MDRLIYLAMTGAQQLLQQQAVASHNLANASTAGFRADTTAFRVAPVVGGPGLPTRAYAVETVPGSDLSQGAIQGTGRDLDAAINGPGFFAVQGTDGTEAYTRSGSFDISPEGELRTRDGRTVLGDGGPIQIPADARISIGQDGTISATTTGNGGTTTNVGRLKLVNPQAGEIRKGADGLFRMKNGGSADADPAVTVTSGALEGSNVNPVSAMVEMISLARQFELQMKLLQHAEGNSQRASQLLAAGA
jgi:flagellar basal-body rod protein FlgF